MIVCGAAFFNKWLTPLTAAPYQFLRLSQEFGRLDVELMGLTGVREEPA